MAPGLKSPISTVTLPVSWPSLLREAWVSDAVTRDLGAIYQYSKENWGIARARTYVQAIKAQFRLLAKGDVSGTQADAITPGLRRLVCGSDVIWFRVEGDVLHVLRVLHTSRDAGRWG